VFHRPRVSASARRRAGGGTQPARLRVGAGELLFDHFRHWFRAFAVAESRGCVLQSLAIEDIRADVRRPAAVVSGTVIRLGASRFDDRATSSPPRWPFDQVFETIENRKAGAAAHPAVCGGELLSADGEESTAVGTAGIHPQSDFIGESVTPVERRMARA
jgi:hypothetical protein